MVCVPGLLGNGKNTAGGRMRVSVGEKGVKSKDSRDGDIIKAFKTKILKRLSGWSRRIDPGLVREDGLGNIPISLPATLGCPVGASGVHQSQLPGAAESSCLQ